MDQTIDFGSSKQFRELNLFDQLPSNALQRWQKQENLSKPAPRVVLSVIDVVLEAGLHLMSQCLHSIRFVEAFGCYSRAQRHCVRDRWKLLSIEYFTRIKEDNGLKTGELAVVHSHVSHDGYDLV